MKRYLQSKIIVALLAMILLVSTVSVAKASSLGNSHVAASTLGATTTFIGSRAAQTTIQRHQVDNSYLKLCFSGQTVSSADQVATTLSNGLNDISDFGTFYFGASYDQRGFTVEPCSGDTSLVYSFTVATTSLMTPGGSRYDTTYLYGVNSFYLNSNGYWMYYYGLPAGTTSSETLTLQATDSTTGLVGPEQQIPYTIYYSG